MKCCIFLIINLIRLYRNIQKYDLVLKTKDLNKKLFKKLGVKIGISRAEPKMEFLIYNKKRVSSCTGTKIKVDRKYDITL